MADEYDYVEENLPFDLDIDDEDDDEVEDEQEALDRYEARLKAIALASNNREEVDNALHTLYESTNQKKTLSEIKDDFYNTLRNLIYKKVDEINAIVDDPVKRGFEQTRLEDWLDNFFSREIRRNMLTEVFSANIQPQIYTFKEALERSEEECNYLVNELLKLGSLILLPAFPKTGKSLLVTSLAIKVLTGGKFLNRQCKKGKILFVQNEEAVADTTQKLHNNGLQFLKQENPEEYDKLVNHENFWLAKDLDIIADVKRIIYMVEKYDIDLVIIDSLAASVGKLGYTEYNQETMAALYNLQKIMHKYDALCIVTHHNNKSDDNSNHAAKIKGVAGFGGITRANDGIWRLSKESSNEDDEESDDKVVKLDIMPRSGKPHKMSIYLVEDEALFWDWEVLSEESLSKQNIRKHNEILRLLLDQYEKWTKDYYAALENEESPPDVYGYTLSQIQAITNDKRNDLIARLNYMVRTEGIELKHRGKARVYTYPECGDSWLKPYLDEEEQEIQKKEELEEMDKEKIDELMACSTREELTDKLNDEFSKEDYNRVLKKFTDEQYQQFWQTLYPPKFVEGQWVRIVELDEVDQISKVKFPKKKPKDSKKAKCHLYYLTKEDFNNQEFREFHFEEWNSDDNTVQQLEQTYQQSDDVDDVDDEEEF